MIDKPAASDLKIPLTFTLEEFDHRLAALRVRMAARGLDTLLVFIPENILYLTGYITIGFSNFQALVVPASGAPLLYIREMERTVAETTTWLSDFAIFADDQDPIEELARTLAAGGWSEGVIGAEMHGGFVSASMMAKIQARIAVLPSLPIVEAGRAIKSSEEIEIIRRACRITEAGLQAAFEQIGPGVTDNSVAAAAYGAMMAAGADFFVTDPIVTSGWRSGVAHTTFSNRVLEPGDAVLLEFGGCYRRYFGPLMRSAALKPFDARIEKMSDVVLEALEATIGAIRAGAVSGDVDGACRGPIERAGFEPYFRKRTGYSVGSAYAPSWGEGHIVSLRKDDPTILQAGMVFHMPPALRMPRQFGVGYSETVLVTETGCEVLTWFPRSLYRVG